MKYRNAILKNININFGENLERIPFSICDFPLKFGYKFAKKKEIGTEAINNDIYV
jgi:hypothetical protein